MHNRIMKQAAQMLDCWGFRFEIFPAGLLEIQFRNLSKLEMG